MTHTSLRLLASSALAVASSVAAFTVSPTAHAADVLPAGWAATSTQAVPLTSTLGPTSPSQTVQLTLGLKPVDPAGLAADFKAMYTPGSATYHQFLTPAQWTAKYAPSAAAVSQVTSYLTSQGFTQVSAASNNLVVTATGTVGEAEAAFHTSIADFSGNGQTLYANTSPALVPAALGGIVQTVIGLHDIPLKVTPQASTNSVPVGGMDLLTSETGVRFRHTYDVGTTPAGSKTAIAIATAGDLTPVISSLRAAEAGQGQPKVPVTVVPVGPQSMDTSAETEWDMDTQMASIVGGTDTRSVQGLYLYNVGQLYDATLTAAMNNFAADDKAPVMSISIGGCEAYSQLDGSMLTGDVIGQQYGMQGQSMFVSSGDEGSACAVVTNTGTPVGPPSVQWPCAGIYVTCVGGTSLVIDANANRVDEYGWLGSGGGVSAFEGPGWWTAQSNPVYATDYPTGEGGRAVPDVALDADPNVSTAGLVETSSGYKGVGGTSLATPLMAGLYSRMQTAHGNALGLASIALYQVYDAVNPGTPLDLGLYAPKEPASPVPGFTDITAGSNGAYTAQAGYDMVTGLGAPDTDVLNTVIGK